MPLLTIWASPHPCPPTNLPSLQRTPKGVPFQSAKTVLDAQAPTLSSGPTPPPLRSHPSHSTSAQVPLHLSMCGSPSHPPASLQARLQAPTLRSTERRRQADRLGSLITHRVTLHIRDTQPASEARGVMCREEFKDSSTVPHSLLPSLQVMHEEMSPREEIAQVPTEPLC